MRSKILSIEVKFFVQPTPMKIGWWDLSFLWKLFYISATAIIVIVIITNTSIAYNVPSTILSTFYVFSHMISPSKKLSFAVISILLMRKLEPRGINRLCTFQRLPRKKGVDWDLNPCSLTPVFSDQVHVPKEENWP